MVCCEENLLNKSIVSYGNSNVSFKLEWVHICNNYKLGGFYKTLQAQNDQFCTPEQLSHEANCLVDEENCNEAALFAQLEKRGRIFQQNL